MRLLGVSTEAPDRRVAVALRVNCARKIRTCRKSIVEWSRCVMQELLERCKQREMKARRLEKGLLPSIDVGRDKGSPTAQAAASVPAGVAKVGYSVMGGLPIPYFEETLHDTPELNLSSDDPKSKSIVKKMVEVVTKAFIMLDRHGKEMKDRNEKKIIDYVGVCQHYAGAAFAAEDEFDKKWEVIIEILKVACGRGAGEGREE